MPEFNHYRKWEKNPNELLNYLNSESLISKPKVINFYIPSFIPLKTKYYQTIPSRFQTYSFCCSQDEL